MNMIEPTESLRLSTERQDESYPWVVKGAGGWAGRCCRGCHGCAEQPITDFYPRPIDAHLARLEWQGKIPVGPARVVDG